MRNREQAGGRLSIIHFGRSLGKVVEAMRGLGRDIRYHGHLARRGTREMQETGHLAHLWVNYMLTRSYLPNDRVLRFLFYNLCSVCSRALL